MVNWFAQSENYEFKSQGYILYTVKFPRLQSVVRCVLQLVKVHAKAINFAYQRRRLIHM